MNSMTVAEVQQGVVDLMADELGIAGEDDEIAAYLSLMDKEPN